MTDVETGPDTGPGVRTAAVAPARRLPAWSWIGIAAVALVAVGLVGFRVGQERSSPPAGDASTTAPVTLPAQPIDTGFAADMADHHAQAVQMALLALDKSSDPAVRTLATEIATSQRREMGRLEQFLRDRGIERTDPTRTVMVWMGEPAPHDAMPGLATNGQIVALTNAGGAEFDRMFLELLRAHHEGGVHMAEFAATNAESQQIRELAAQMVVQQQREISEIDQLTGG